MKKLLESMGIGLVYILDILAGLNWSLIYIYCFVMVMDLVTGAYKAMYTGSFESKKMKEGLIRKDCRIVFAICIDFFARCICKFWNCDNNRKCHIGRICNKRSIKCIRKLVASGKEDTRIYNEMVRCIKK